MQKRSKKGFTLAELLIVVAIIAVLVAIAVPLFVGSLQKAEKARDDANVRAIRGTAVVFLLDHSGEAKYWNLKGDATEAIADAWNIEATISGTGDIKLTKVEPIAAPGSDTAPTKTKEGDGFKFTLVLTKTDISSFEATGGVPSKG